MHFPSDMRRCVRRTGFRISQRVLTGALLWLFGFTCTPLFAAGSEPRERLSFNDEWRFIKGDPEDAGGSLSYTNLKPWMIATGPGFTTNTAPVRPDGQPGADVAYTRPDFDDSVWRKLDLPHDWAVEGPFNMEFPHETGKLPYWGVGWYRKSFDVPTSDRGRRIYLDVDGAMSFANVWINGEYVGGWPYGYASWRVDLTPHIRFGAENLVAIRLDNPADSSRWYPGAGIYRNVWLVKTAPVHVAQWGTHITTPEIGRDAAAVAIKVKLENRSNEDARIEAEADILTLGRDGEKSSAAVAVAETIRGFVPAGSNIVVRLNTRIHEPLLWGVEDPSLYVAVITIRQDEQIVDQYEETFGVRTIEFTPEQGFFLNGELTEIQGVCLHHDLGALGAAFNLRARERQLEMLKEMGCNAIRTSHNPLEPELLDLCDRMGFLVMNEAFDAWQMAKRDNDYHILFDDWHEKDLRAFMRRDRNHPSVIMWSLGNEVYEQRQGTNAWLAEHLAEIAHQEDPTRPVNMALHVIAASTNGFQNALDVFGYNYSPFAYAEFKTNNPNQPLIGSETSSCVSSRGEYFFPVVDDRKQGRVNFQITSYDYAAPSWAMSPDKEFQGQDENPFVAGEFVWTGFDYLGEPTPFDRDTTNRLEFTDPELQAQAERQLETLGRILVPSRSSYFGIIDLAGFKKDRFYSYQSRWRPNLPMAHILPHWNWPERLGQVTPVHVYTSGEEAELFLNGKSLGRRKKGVSEYRLRWNDVVYEPGELKVVAFKHGGEWATDVMKTTGSAVALQLDADRDLIRADGTDLSFVTVRVIDREGLLVPRTMNPVRFVISGPGEIIATDNGDPISHMPFQSLERNAFNGLALAIVRSKAGERGTITVKALSEGLSGGVVQIRTR